MDNKVVSYGISLLIAVIIFGVILAVILNDIERFWNDSPVLITVTLGLLLFSVIFQLTRWIKAFSERKK